jgi:hypothetical protein
MTTSNALTSHQLNRESIIHNHVGGREIFHAVERANLGEAEAQSLTEGHREALSVYVKN